MSELGFFMASTLHHIQSHSEKRVPKKAQISTATEENSMRVRKRNGILEPVDVVRITKKVARFGVDLKDINPYLIASKAISGIYDGVTTTELDSLLIQTSAMLIGDEPKYSKLAARLLTNFIDKEVGQQQITRFSQSIKTSLLLFTKQCGHKSSGQRWSGTASCRRFRKLARNGETTSR